MEYHLKPLGKTCAGTGKLLAPGSQCISVVVDDGHELKRLDYSKEGWKGPPEGTLAQWQCLVPTPVDVKKRLLNPDALMNYFDQLTEEANPLQEIYFPGGRTWTLSGHDPHGVRGRTARYYVGEVEYDRHQSETG